MSGKESLTIAVCGAGPCGIASVGRLLDLGVSVIWIDSSDFQCGRMDKFYRNVPANTPNGDLVSCMVLCDSFEFKARQAVRRDRGEETLEDAETNACNPLGLLTDALRDATEAMLPRVRRVDAKLTKLTMNDERRWMLEVGKYDESTKTVTPSIIGVAVDGVILAIGATPIVPPSCVKLSGVSVLPLDSFVCPVHVDRYMSSSPSHVSKRYAVVGSSHSALLVIMNLLKSGVAPSRILNIHRSPSLRFQLSEGRGGVAGGGPKLFPGSGLKGPVGDWARSAFQDLPLERRSYDPGATWEAQLAGVDSVVFAMGFENNDLPLVQVDAGNCEALGTYEEVRTRSCRVSGALFTSANDKRLDGLWGAGIFLPQDHCDVRGNVEGWVGVKRSVEQVDVMLRDMRGGEGSGYRCVQSHQIAAIGRSLNAIDDEVEVAKGLTNAATDAVAAFEGPIMETRLLLNPVMIGRSLSDLRERFREVEDNTNTYIVTAREASEKALKLASPIVGLSERLELFEKQASLFGEFDFRQKAILDKLVSRMIYAPSNIGETKNLASHNSIRFNEGSSTVMSYFLFGKSFRDLRTDLYSAPGAVLGDKRYSDIAPKNSSELPRNIYAFYYNFYLGLSALSKVKPLELPPSWLEKVAPDQMWNKEKKMMVDKVDSEGIPLYKPSVCERLCDFFTNRPDEGALKDDPGVGALRALALAKKFVDKYDTENAKRRANEMSAAKKVEAEDESESETEAGDAKASSATRKPASSSSNTSPNNERLCQRLLETIFPSSLKSSHGVELVTSVIPEVAGKQYAASEFDGVLVDANTREILVIVEMKITFKPNDITKKVQGFKLVQAKRRETGEPITFYKRLAAAKKKDKKELVDVKCSTELRKVPIVYVAESWHGHSQDIDVKSQAGYWLQKHPREVSACDILERAWTTKSAEEPNIAVNVDLCLARDERSNKTLRETLDDLSGKIEVDDDIPFFGVVRVVDDGQEKSI